ncbi:MAG TPA: hypothetical protein PK294_04120 [Ignavibacteria bacterium]|nr:hypothetical protein [Ignavibacteria bacterium]HRA99607.1 hypothetical protein [Ignavibacteria bacterium]
MKKSGSLFLKPIYLFLYIFILSNSFVFAQTDNVKLNIKSESNYQNPFIQQTSGSGLTVFALLFPLNPILMIENDKFYVGITKEFSFGKFPFGRAAVEYSLIFRETHVNQLRFSYNFDIPLVSGDFAVIMFSAGGGYFTDFDKKGYFPQTSVALLLPASETFTANVYFKTRYTIMDDKSESNIFDITFGLSAAIYF